LAAARLENVPAAWFLLSGAVMSARFQALPMPSLIMSKPRSRSGGGGHGWLWRWAAVCVGTVTVAALAYHLPVLERIVALQGWFRGQGVLGGVLYAAGFAVGIVLLLPGSILSAGAGFTFGFLWGSVIVWVGALAGATLAFVIGRHGPRARVEWLSHRHPKFAAARDAVGEEGWKVVAMLRLSVIAPFTPTNYLLGLTPVRLSTFVSATAIAMLPGILLHTALGAAGNLVVGGRPVGTLAWVGLATGIGFAVAATVILTRAARRRLEKGQGT
jgi:uncharacterized membrane protein YdjX (TVP38/TMEM64 family)